MEVTRCMNFELGGNVWPVEMDLRIVCISQYLKLRLTGRWVTEKKVENTVQFL